jgi:RNA polymerase sigma-70 factor (ECF subfamily)
LSVRLINGKDLMTDETQQWKDTEKDLIVRAQQGDRSAYADLIYQHQRGVINVVYRMCGDPALAEDASQEAFIRAWLKLPAYRPTAPFRSWLYRIAINVALDTLRHQKQDVRMEMHNLSIGENPEALLVHKEQTDRVREAVLSLPDASRTVLVLREFEGLSYQEIASALDIPVGTVMSRLNYARSSLRSLLGLHARRLEENHV